MKTEQPRRQTVSRVDSSKIRKAVLGDIVNVTWRLAVPTVVGLFAGMGIDALATSSPIGFLVGATGGFIIGLALCIRLLHYLQENR